MSYSVKCSALSQHDFEAALLLHAHAIPVSVSQHSSYNEASPTAHVTNRRRKHLLSKKWKYTFNTVALTGVTTAIVSFTVLLTRHRNLAFTH